MKVVKKFLGKILYTYIGDIEKQRRERNVSIIRKYLSDSPAKIQVEDDRAARKAVQIFSFMKDMYVDLSKFNTDAHARHLFDFYCDMYDHVQNKELVWCKLQEIIKSNPKRT